MRPKQHRSIIPKRPQGASDDLSKKSKVKKTKKFISSILKNHRYTLSYYRRCQQKHQSKEVIKTKEVENFADNVRYDLDSDDEDDHLEDRYDIPDEESETRDVCENTSKDHEKKKHVIRKVENNEEDRSKPDENRSIPMNVTITRKLKKVEFVDLPHPSSYSDNDQDVRCSTAVEEKRNNVWDNTSVTDCEDYFIGSTTTGAIKKVKIPSYPNDRLRYLKDRHKLNHQGKKKAPHRSEKRSFIQIVYSTILDELENDPILKSLSEADFICPIIDSEDRKQLNSQNYLNTTKYYGDSYSSEEESSHGSSDESECSRSSIESTRPCSLDVLNKYPTVPHLSLSQLEVLRRIKQSPAAVKSDYSRNNLDYILETIDDMQDINESTTQVHGKKANQIEYLPSNGILSMFEDTFGVEEEEEKSEQGMDVIYDPKSGSIEIIDTNLLKTLMEPRADTRTRLFQTISSRSISDLSNYLSATELYPSNSFGSSRNDESLMFRNQTNAATCIQSFVRGALCRQRVMEKIIMDSRTYAAGQIQQWYIRCVAIKEQKKRLAAATKIQSFWRMRITQQFLDILSIHVTKLQSIIRRRIALCKYIRAHKSIIIIQNQWRYSVLRENKRIEREKLKREKLEEAAAIRIQSIARKYIQERSFLFQKNFGLTGDSEFALRRVRSESESEAEEEQNSYDIEYPTVEGEHTTHFMENDENIHRFGAHEQEYYLSKQHGELVRTYLMEQEGLSSPSSTKKYYENYDSYHYSNYHTMNKVQEDHNFANGHHHGHTIFPTPSGNDEVPISKLETFGLSKDSSLISRNDDLEVTTSPFLASRSSSLIMNQDRHNPDSVRIQSPNEEIQYNSVKATKDSFIPTELSSELYTFSNVSSQSFPKINSASDHKHIFEMPQHTSSSVASSIVPENSLISMKNSSSSHQYKSEPPKGHVEVQLEEKNNHIMSENLETYNIENEGFHSQQKLQDLPHSSHAKIKKSFNKKIVSSLKKKFSYRKSKKTHTASDQMDHDIISRNTMISQSIPSIVTTEISTTNLQYGNLNHTEQVNYVVDRDRFQYNIETQTVTTASESHTGYSKTLRNMKAELVSVQQLLRNVMIDNSHINTGNLPAYGRTEGTYGVSTNNNTGRAVRNEGYNHVSDSISHNEISGREELRNANATVVPSIPAVTNYHHPNHTHKTSPMDHRKYYAGQKNDHNVILPQSEISRGFNSVEIPLNNAEIGHSEQIKHMRSLDSVAAVSTHAVRFLGSNNGAEEGDVRDNLYLSLSPSTETYKKSNLEIEHSRANDTRGVVLDQYNSEFYGDKNVLRMTRTEVMSENIVDSNEKRDEELGLLRKERSFRNGWFE